MSRKGSAGGKLAAGRQDRDNFTRNMITTAEPVGPSAGGSGPVGGDPVPVRTIRPHDTTEGVRAPGEEYERPGNEASFLEARGVVEILTS